MLREVDLNKNLTKKEYKEMMDKLAPKFAALQREARAKGLPVMVVFEGWGASGKGTMISRLIQPLEIQRRQLRRRHGRWRRSRFTVLSGTAGRLL